MNVYINGEPEFPIDDLNDQKIDLFLSSTIIPGRDNMFYADFLWNENSNPASAKALHERQIDILYRSSNCRSKTGQVRHAVAETIAKKAHDQGLHFVSSGSCTTKHGSNIRSKSPGRNWGKCDECADSKMILALERFEEGNPYLSEKANLAFNYGAIPVYRGNGSEIMENIIGISPQSYVNISDLSPEAGAEKVLQSFDEITQYSLKKNDHVYEQQIEAIRNFTCPRAPHKNEVTLHLNYPNLKQNQISELENMLCLENKEITYSKQNPDFIISGHIEGRKTNWN